MRSAGSGAALVWAMAAAGVLACGRDEAASAPVAVVDSTLSIQEELRRFRAGPEATERLRGGAADRDELVRRFVGAVERGDTVALARLVLTAAEFAWLYYPHTRYTAPPYELGPALLWFQIQNASSRGITRLLRRHGGGPLGVTAYACVEEPAREGPNRVWAGCRAILGQPPDTASLRLFGSILERDGVYKLVSFANEL